MLYALLNYPLRSSVEDHLYSFARFSSHRVFYLNLAVRDIPRRIQETEFDLVIFHTSLLSTRWTPWLWRIATRRALSLPHRGETRAALPQDEFLRTEMLSEFLDESGVRVVFSVAPESEWPKIYPRLSREKIVFHRVLTGYLDECRVQRADRAALPLGDRPVAIGYRASSSRPWLGRHGQLKVTVAERVKDAAAARGLPTDISTRAQDTIVGDGWFRFLGHCRYQVGVEGGASVLDVDGSVKSCTEAFLARHPGASFEEVESVCFPNRDGEVALFALSPRHLEACATRTCQMLDEGTYNGILQPGVHYLELARDLSNLEDVLDTIERDDRRTEIVETAYRDIVASGRYTYRSFVTEVESVALPPIAHKDAVRDDQTWRVTQALDRLSWRDVALRTRALELGSRVLGPTARRIRYARQGARTAN